MADSRGKIFEREFRKGLSLLPGFYIRLFDGANFAKQRQPADFVYMAYFGNNFLIECKSTNEASLPLQNIRDHQIAELARWQSVGIGGVGLLAVEFWRYRRTFLLPIDYVKKVIDDGERKSISLDMAADNGFEIFRKSVDGSFYYALTNALEVKRWDRAPW